MEFMQLQSKFLFWWENVGGAVELRSSTAGYRGEMKAYLISVFGRRNSLTLRDLPNLRFTIARVPEQPRDRIAVLLVDRYVCGGIYIPTANGTPPMERQYEEALERLRKMYAELCTAGRWSGTVVKM